MVRLPTTQIVKCILVNGKPYLSPKTAAMSLSAYIVDRWIVKQCRKAIIEGREADRLALPGKRTERQKRVYKRLKPRLDKMFQAAVLTT